MDSASKAPQASIFDSATNDFLDAVVGGPKSLEVFYQKLCSFQQDISQSVPKSKLTADETLRSSIAANDIAVLSKAFLDMQLEASSIDSQLRMESEKILNGLVSVPKVVQPYLRSSKPSLQALRHPTTTLSTSALASVFPSRSISGTSSTTTSTRSASDLNSLPEFIEHAYKFFVANISNPYPTREEKQTIVDKSNNSDVTLNSVSNWFVNVRRRCGWTEILKRRFDGKKEVMVDIAKQVFIRPDPSRPVDLEIIAEFMELKRNVESMYEKLRASSWIDDLENLDELIKPISEEERLSTKKRETEERREARRRAKEILREQREYEKQKRKMQSEALHKAEKVIRRAHEKEMRLNSGFTSSSLDDEEESSEPVSIPGGKRKACHDDFSIYEFRNVSESLLSPYSSFSEFSSDGRVPSLTWSDSGDEERPYKRPKSIPSTPQPDALNAIYPFNLTLNPMDTVFQTPPRGQKRSHPFTDNDPTPRAKRVKSNTVTHTHEEPKNFELPQSLLFSHPSSSSGATATQATRRKSSVIATDIQAILDESFLSLNPLDPPTVEITPPETDLPIEVFDWSNLGADGLDMDNFDSQWLQFLQPQDASEALEQQTGQLSFDSMFSFVLPDGGLVPQETNEFAASQSLENVSSSQTLGFMDSLLATEAFKNPLSIATSEAVSCTTNLPSSPSVTPALPSDSTFSLLDSAPRVAEITDKALLVEQKRRELQEKKAELEREQARLIEMERELEGS